MDYIKVIGTPLYQWEAGRKIQIIPLPKMHINAVHFSNFGDSEALVVEPREENGIIIADIPNILLQSGKNIVVYTVNISADSVETLVERTFSVRNRAKPGDYVYTETEVLTITTAVEKALQEAKESGEFDGKDGIDGKDGKDGKDADVSIVANALKGSASGAAIALNDVSPFEHEMKVSVDVGGATVKKYGKNLFNPTQYSVITGTTTLNGDTITTTFQNAAIHIMSKQTFAAGRYTISIFPEGEVACGLFFYDAKKYKEGALVQVAPTKTQAKTNEPIKYTFTASSDFIFGISGVSGNYGTYSYKIQLEVGSIASVSYGTYKEPITYTADENGNITGIIGNGESFTLIADNGATISAEYNKDTNKVIESLVNAIISLGGNV